MDALDAILYNMEAQINVSKTKVLVFSGGYVM